MKKNDVKKRILKKKNRRKKLKKNGTRIEKKKKKHPPIRKIAWENKKLTLHVKIEKLRPILKKSNIQNKILKQNINPSKKNNREKKNL